MKKIIVGTVVVAAATALLRRFGPALARACMSKCGEMVERLPEHAPPKQMMRKLEQTRETKQTTPTS